MKISCTNRLSVSVIAVLAYASMIGDAHAYVDPGSGSVIVTTILGLVAAVGYTFRKYFYKLKRVCFSRSEVANSDMAGSDVTEDKR